MLPVGHFDTIYTFFLIRQIVAKIFIEKKAGIFRQAFNVKVLLIPVDLESEGISSPEKA
jgi:hypothetical protein